MAKQREKDLGKKFFVEWGKTLEEIHVDLVGGGYKVSKRQLWQWSKDGKWREERDIYRSGQTTTMDKLKAFIDSELDQLDAEKKAGGRPSVQRLHSLQNMLEQWQRMRRQAVDEIHKVDEETEEDGDDDPGQPMTVETFAKLFKEEFSFDPL